MEQTCPQLLTYHHVKMNSLETQPKLVAVPKMFAHFHSLPPWFLLPIFASLITVAMVFPVFFLCGSICCKNSSLKLWGSMCFNTKMDDLGVPLFQETSTSQLMGLIPPWLSFTPVVNPTKPPWYHHAGCMSRSRPVISQLLVQQRFLRIIPFHTSH